MKDGQIAVSIIVPVYNVEAYLKQCLDSVVNQTLKNVEIILVNDGSTDESVEICKQYLSDDRVILLNQSNSGLAAARQAGMNIAKGEYIGFVDSDDWLEPTMYEELYAAAKQNDADIVFCNVYRNENKKEQIYFPPGFYDRVDMEKTIFPQLLAAFNADQDECTIRWCNWLRIYRRRLIEENQICFDPRFRRCQDLPFTFECTIHAEKYYYLGDRYLYHNRMNFESLSKGYTKTMWELLKPLVAHLQRVVTNYTRYDFTAQMHLRAMLTAFECADNESKPNNTRRLRERISTIRTIMKEANAFGYLPSTQPSGMRRIYKLNYFCFRHRLPLLYYLLSRKRYASRQKEYNLSFKRK